MGGELEGKSKAELRRLSSPKLSFCEEEGEQRGDLGGGIKGL